jgi:hypothetical protein
MLFCIDIYLHVCDYLYFDEIILLTRINKTYFYQYHDESWIYIKKIDYSNSIIKDIKSLKDAIRTHFYYKKNVSFSIDRTINSYKPIKEINKIECHMQRLINSNSLCCINKTMNYKNAELSRLCDLMEFKKQVIILANNLNPILKKHISLFNYDPYFTAKKIDVRLYGIYDDHKDSDTVKKFITGEYSHNLFITIDEPDIHQFKYVDVIDDYAVGRMYIAYRILPDCLKYVDI